MAVIRKSRAFSGFLTTNNNNTQTVQKRTLNLSQTKPFLVLFLNLGKCAPISQFRGKSRGIGRRFSAIWLIKVLYGISDESSEENVSKILSRLISKEKKDENLLEAKIHLLTSPKRVAQIVYK